MRATVAANFFDISEAFSCIACFGPSGILNPVAENG